VNWGRRAVLRGAGLALLAAPGAPRAQTLPQTPVARTITLVVGGIPGGRYDAGARSFAPFLERQLPGTTIEILNIKGGGGLAALEHLARAEPNGSVLGWVATPALSARLVEHGSPGGGTALLERLRLVGAVEKEPIAFVSPAAAPLTSIQQVIARAGADALPLATPEAGTPPHLTALRLQQMVGRKLNITPFPTGAAVLEAVLAGNVAAAALSLGQALGPLRERKLVGIGVTSADRSDILPGLPPLFEAGLPLTSVIRRGLAVPMRIPEKTFQALVSALQAIAGQPDIIAEAGSDGFIVDYLSGADWRQRCDAERAELEPLWRADPWTIPEDR
jgi:tripartite-type tricarboxylate transporter receptor subunit TctC